jgi:signal transduction histidine kinase
MNPIVHSPANKSKLGALMQKSKRPNNRARRFRSARIAHELKNCMSMLILAVADLETRSSDPSAVFQSRRETFEKAVFEINTLVDELVQLVQEGTHKERMSER